MQIFQQLKEVLFFYRAIKIKSYSRKSVYTSSLAKKIPRGKIKTVIEIGARDLRDTFAIKLYYKPKIIYAFEANPAALPVCTKTLKKYWMFRNGIYFVPKAVWNENKVIKFYSVEGIKLKYGNQEINLNPGMSSCFKQAALNKDEEVIQEEVDIEAVRLDSFCVEHHISEIDLLCMDIEGAEYNALIGLGDYINKVNYIITESHLKSDKIGWVCFDAVEPFLRSKGFVLLDAWDDGNPYYRNFLFAKK